MSLLHPGLEAFVAVIHQSTVHGAAKQIGLTQTGVTQRIRALERQLGLTLFTRSRSGMRPTVEGEALYRYCRAAKDLEGELLSSLLSSNAEASVRIDIIGPSSTMRTRVIPGAMSILGNFANVQFTFNLNDSGQALSHLKSGASQLAILNRREVVNELDSKLLNPANYILVATPKWAQRGLENIITNECIIDFNEPDEATFDYLKKYDLFDLAKKDRHFANNIDALATIVASGWGYSVLLEDFAAPFLKTGKLINIHPGYALKTEFALAWYPRPEMPAYFAALIKAIQ